MSRSPSRSSPSASACSGHGRSAVPYALVGGMVQQGLRAQLKSGNLLTGELIVDLGFHPEAAPAELRMDTGSHPEIPSVPAELEAITSSVHQVLEQARRPRRSPSWSRTSATPSRASTIWCRRRRPLGALPALSQTADAATMTLGNADMALRSSTTASSASTRSSAGDTSTLMAELTSAARSIRALTTYLERHPEALIRGKSGGY